MNLEQVLRDHKLWLDDSPTGKRANLYGADLSGANLSGAKLSRADLRSANLYDANLSGADLYGANLSDADLYGADLYGADLRSANLSGANLSRADLCSANLCGATLDYPIYQFFIGSFNAVATSRLLRIGCESHSWETWLDEVKRKEIADKNGMNDAAFINHSKMIVLMHELITNPARTNK